MMGTRLNQELRKDDGSSVLLRTRPGVFALRSWSDGAPTTAESFRETLRLHGAAPEAPVVVLGEALAEAELEDVSGEHDAEEAASPSLAGATGPVEPADVEGVDASLQGESVASGRRRRRRRRRLVERLEEDGGGEDGAEDGVEVGDGLEAEEEEGDAPSGEQAVGLLAVVEAEASVVASVEVELEAPEASEGVVVESAAPALAEVAEGSRAWGTLADRVEQVLTDRFDDPDGVAATRLLDALESGGSEVGGSADALRLMLLADNLERYSARRLPRFEDNGRGSWRLAKWAQSEAAREGLAWVQRGEDALVAEAIQQVQGWLSTLTLVGLETVIGMLVARTGGRQFEVVQRSEHGFVARWTVSGLVDVPTLAWVVTGAAGWGLEEGLLALEGGAPASRLVIDVGGGGRDAALPGHAARATWMGARQLAEQLVTHRLGVRCYEATLVVEDAPFFLALGASEPAG